ncbi:hypothetical protein E4U34_000297 [Claviceps purpurea]|nr:hypothetical protein E4U10_004899 [Claviceps purpurea]KAG6204521.1 hypothetical protein E4U50_005186 [Claviceps purpurea]KAG6224481.1 hypothetical protein E4U34_000297 [Claviceps purpurea]KAG6258214.1 hypothetical protein E4U49_006465 [Claviceps purpurea]KAG6300345.1 hypothetical protein E4U45_003998 [Claviceps purpurea]
MDDRSFGELQLTVLHSRFAIPDQCRIPYHHHLSPCLLTSRLKHPTNIENFNATRDVELWLKILHRSYRNLDGSQDVDPSEFIQPIDSALALERRSSCVLEQLTTSTA